MELRSLRFSPSLIVLVLRFSVWERVGENAKGESAIKMKLAKYLAVALVILPLAGCSSQPAVDPDAKAQPGAGASSQITTNVPPERQAEAQAQAAAARAQGEAYAKQMEERFKSNK